MSNKLKSILSILFVILITIFVFFLLDYIPYFKSLGYFGAFIISLISSITIIVPVPSWTVIFFMAKVLNPFLLGIVAGLGSAMGELTGYYLGKEGTQLVDNKTYLKKYTNYVNNYGSLAIFIFALVPNPIFDIAGIAAGAMNMKLWKFMLASILGKIIRYVIFAYSGFYTLNIFF